METKNLERIRKTINVGKGERIASILVGAGLLTYSAKEFSAPKVITGLGSAYMLYRGISGKDPIYRSARLRWGKQQGVRGLQVLKSITIYVYRDQIYNFWRTFSNLPAFMEHLESVTERTEDGRVSHWIAKGPLGKRVEWDAEVLEDIPNERISWRSLPGSMITSIGSVEFVDALNGRGTEVTVSLVYEPPAGAAGALAARLLGEEPARQVEEDLRRLKRTLEAGQVITVKGQTSGRIKQVEQERKLLEEIREEWR